MRRRYSHLCEQEVAGVPASRLLDAAKLLHATYQFPIHDAAIRAVAEQVLGGDQMSDDDWGALRQHTEDAGFGLSDAGGAFLIDPDYLKECVTFNPSREHIEGLIPVLASADEREGLFSLGVALEFDYRSPLAEQAYRLAGSASSGRAYNNLGNLLSRQSGREAEAEAAFQTAIDLGSTAAPLELGNLLVVQEGREGDAEAAYRVAIGHGSLPALNNLGVLFLRQPGREAEAEETIRAGVARGIQEAHVNLGVLLSSQEGREQEAEAAYRIAVSTGVETATGSLAHLLARQPGREAEAELTYRAAIELGDERGHNGLGVLLLQQAGREREAEIAFRAAVADGNIRSLYGLAMALSAQPGKEAEAEAACRQAIDAGAPAHRLLGDLLSAQPGREVEAEAVYQVAILTDSGEAHSGLALLLARQPGREADAEAAYRVAAREGMERVNYGLGLLLARQPGREADAEVALRAATAQAHPDAPLNLGNLLSRQPGREADAEAVYRAAIAAGDLRGVIVLRSAQQKQGRQDDLGGMAPLLDTLSEFFDATSQDDLRQVLHGHPELLGTQAEALMEALGGIYVDDEVVQSLLSRRLALVRRCREIGVDLACDEAARSEEAHRPPELNEVMAELDTMMAPPLDISAASHRLALCERALALTQRSSDPRFWAGLQVILGGSHLAVGMHTKGHEGRVDPINRAIRAYQAALQVFSQEVTPLQWAIAMRDLANAYAQSVDGDTARNLELAVGAAEQALQVSALRQKPQEWGRANLVLARALSVNIG